MHAQDSTSVRRQVLIPGSRERVNAQLMLDALLRDAEAVITEEALDGHMDIPNALSGMTKIVSRRAVTVICDALEAKPERRFVEVAMWPAKVGA
jgi:hypothetical protein